MSKSADSRDKESTEVAIGPDAVAKVYADIFTHEDRIIWQQITTLMGLEAVTVAAGFGTRGSWWAPMSILVGVVFTTLLYFFIHKVRLDREHAADVVNSLWEKYCTDDLKQLLREQNRVPKVRGSVITRADDGPRLFQMVYLGGKHFVRRAADPPWMVTVRGHSLLQWAVMLFLFFNCALFGFFVARTKIPLGTALRGITGS